MKPNGPITLIIFDGWGYSEETQHNAIAQANTPNFDELWKNCPHSLIEGSGNYVGLPNGQMGNSEVGHLNLGAGRIVQQMTSRISSAIENGGFFKDPILLSTVKQLLEQDKALHILGLLSPGGVHSHEDQIHAAVKFASEQGLKKIYLHCFLDGRDTPPQSALPSIQKLEKACSTYGAGDIISLVGRYYAMDRDQRWDRTQLAYDLLTQGKATRHANTAEEALKAAYADNEVDEFVKPCSIQSKNGALTVIEDGDAILFMNFRADRARQITRAFIDDDFSGFHRDKMPKLSNFVTLTQYDEKFDVPVIFPPEKFTNVLGEYLAKNKLRQLRIAETEKYAHVTFFFNGGVEKPFALEERKLISSPKVATYDLQPEMSARELTQELTSAIETKQYDVIICNFANADMVGHTGKLDEAVKAIECLDECLGKIVETSKMAGGELLITADHGNAEKMYNEETQQPHTAHTSNPVPFIYRGRPATSDKKDGALSDIAPTILYLLGLEIPEEMTGQPLVNLAE